MALNQKIDSSGDRVYSGNNGAWRIGTFSSSTAGYGVQLKADRTRGMGVYGDDGGAAVSTGTLSAGLFRTLITAAVTTSTWAGIQGQVKMVNTATPDWAAGVWGYAESSGTSKTVKNLFGVRATVDAPSGITIASGGRVAGLVIDSIDLGGTHTGKAACMYLPAPGTGSWDYFIDTAAQTNICSANTHSVDGHALAFVMKCRMGSTDGYLPFFASVPA